MGFRPATASTRIKRAGSSAWRKSTHVSGPLTAAWCSRATSLPSPGAPWLGTPRRMRTRLKGPARAGGQGSGSPEVYPLSFPRAPHVHSS